MVVLRLVLDAQQAREVCRGICINGADRGERQLRGRRRRNASRGGRSRRHRPRRCPRERRCWQRDRTSRPRTPPRRAPGSRGPCQAGREPRPARSPWTWARAPIAPASAGGRRRGGSPPRAALRSVADRPRRLPGAPRSGTPPRGRHCPSIRDVFRKRSDLPIPTLVDGVHSVPPNDEQIDVAVGAPVSASGRTEHRDVLGGHGPALDPLGHPREQAPPHVRQQAHGGREQVLTVEEVGRSSRCTRPCSRRKSSTRAVPLALPAARRATSRPESGSRASASATSTRPCRPGATP